MEFLLIRQGEVEPFQLQILCRHAEQRVSLRQLEGTNDSQVDETLLRRPKGNGKITRKFLSQRDSRAYVMEAEIAAARSL